jgi:choline dehydrogenase-like flavoprotein
MVRAERGLKEIGLDLSPEFEELEKLLRLNFVPRNLWRPVTQRMFDAVEEMGLKPRLTPKALDIDRCVQCGLCEIGCFTKARWDARRFLTDVETKNGKVFTDSPVQRIIVEKGRAIGVEIESDHSARRIEGDVIVLAAGGIGTAQILNASKLSTRDNGRYSEEIIPA